MWLTMLASAMLANDSTYRSSPTVSGATATQIFSIMIILSHCLLVAITRLRAITSHYKEDHEVILILRSLTQPRKGWPCDRGCTFPILFERWGGFFYVLQEPDQARIWDKYWAISQTRAEGPSFWGAGEQAPPGTGQMSTWKVFFIIKNIFIMKKLTNFRKAVEAGVDPLRQMSESVVRPDWPTVFRPYPRRLERLTICRCHHKRSTFF